MVPTAIDGGPGLSIFYTSATHLPIHWSRPHTRGAEGVSVITSSDGGKTCESFAYDMNIRP
jgi:beta-fructofuranosidase